MFAGIISVLDSWFVKIRYFSLKYDNVLNTSSFCCRKDYYAMSA